MKYLLATILSLSFLAFGNAQEGNWELKKNEQGIKIWLSETSGSDYKTFKAETTIKADLETVLAKIKDVESIQDYYDGITGAHDIRQINEAEAEYFLEFSFPWPVKKRRAFVKSKVMPVEVGSYEISTIAYPTDKTKNGFVQVEKMSSIWILINAGNGSTLVRTIAHMDPSGSIPAWIANAKVIDTPFKSLINLKELLEAKN